MILESYPRGQPVLRCPACGGTLAVITPRGVFHQGVPMLVGLESTVLFEGPALTARLHAQTTTCGRPGVWLSVVLPTSRPDGVWLARRGDQSWVVSREHGRSTHLFGPAPLEGVVGAREAQEAALGWVEGVLRDVLLVLPGHEGGNLGCSIN